MEGTRALAEAFLKNSGRRFVHISSVAAYGSPRDGDLREDTPPNPTEDPYSNTKLKIESLLRDLHQTRRLPVAIVQPTIVYGPFGSTWTTRLLEQIRSNRIVLPSGGAGLCNAVYVDDVVAASMLTVEGDASVGEAFLISGSSPTTWREFYSAYERMVGNRLYLTSTTNKYVMRKSSNEGATLYMRGFVANSPGHYGNRFHRNWVFCCIYLTLEHVRCTLLKPLCGLIRRAISYATSRRLI